MQSQPQTTSYLIAGVVLLVVMVLRLRRAGRPRRLRVERLWVVPAILLVLTILTFAEAPPSLAAVAASTVALLIGAAVGWQRGRLMRITVDPETHELNQASSAGAMLFIVAIILVRFGARALAESGTLPVHADPRAMSDVLLSFAFGMFGVARLEMFLRAKRLLAEARVSVFS